MIPRLFLIAALCCLGTGTSSAADDVRFASVEMYLDSAEPVAAWQFELADVAGLMRVVGVENGESDAFDGVPYYDREAVRLGTSDRIIIADYSLADLGELPSGRTRITTVHIMLAGDGEPDLRPKLITATRADGSVIDAALSYRLSTGSEQ